MSNCVCIVTSHVAKSERVPNSVCAATAKQTKTTMKSTEKCQRSLSEWTIVPVSTAVRGWKEVAAMMRICASSTHSSAQVSALHMPSAPRAAHCRARPDSVRHTHAVTASAAA
eukprot:2077202-Rhodomonas_salina.2